MNRKWALSRGRVHFLAILGLSLLILATAVQSSQETKQNNSRQAENAGDEKAIAQGKYIVHHVAMCIQCHTPKDSQGNLLESRLLQGATIPVDNPYANQAWALNAPKLAGLPGGWSEEALATFLETGQQPSEYSIRPPMPPFRMKKEDAQAVAAYLRSLDGNR